LLDENVRIASFDGTEVVTGNMARPERYRDLAALLERGPVAARGAGLSYAAASMGERVTSVDMTKFDRILAFDPVSGDVTVEAGVRVGALTDFLVARGYFLPVLPGYPDITVGGCVAFDVHGKSQVHSGNFAEWVRELWLLHPDHGELCASPVQRSELFDLTLGGFGLTGLITRVSLRTSALPGSSVEVEAVPIRNLQEAAELIQRRVDEVDGLYSWHNLNLSSRFGAGVVFIDRFVQRHSAPGARKRSAHIRRRSPFPVWNRFTTPLAMAGYETLQRLSGRKTVNLRQAMFPIEGLEVFYLAFGSRGFREYQIIVPVTRWEPFLTGLERLTRRSRMPIPLASLKLFKGAPRNLAFAGEGLCLAIDVPAVPEAFALFSDLDELAAQHGASVNLSKDSRAPEQLCRAIFAGYDQFRQALHAFDPRRRFQSRLRERIGV
jgi:decaprenylphospho-beta-D-ribofuranose 2-oxidase